MSASLEAWAESLLTHGREPLGKLNSQFVQRSHLFGGRVSLCFGSEDAHMLSDLPVLPPFFLVYLFQAPGGIELKRAAGGSCHHAKQCRQRRELDSKLLRHGDAICGLGLSPLLFVLVTALVRLAHKITWSRAVRSHQHRCRSSAYSEIGDFAHWYQD